MNRYTCSDTRAIRAESMREAAETAAGILARRYCGRRGRVGTLRQDCYVEDGSSAGYEAFIGVPGREPQTLVGCNVRFNVYAEGGAR